MNFGINCDIIGLNSTGNNMISWILNKLFQKKRNHEIMCKTILVGDQLQLNDKMIFITAIAVTGNIIESTKKYKLLGPYGPKMSSNYVDILQYTPFSEIKRNISYDERKANMLRNIEAMRYI